MRLIVYEDGFHEDLRPLTLTRPTFELRCGATSLLEKIASASGLPVGGLFVRDYLAATVRRRHAGTPVNDPAALRGDDLLLVNGACLCLQEKLHRPALGEAAEAEGRPLVASLPRAAAEGAAGAPSVGDLLEGAAARTRRPAPPGLFPIRYPWQLIQQNVAAIRFDFERAGRSGIHGGFHPSAVVFGDPNLAYVAPKAQVHPFVCIETRHGPVTIDEGAVLTPFTRIEGPAYVGKETQLFGAKVREGTALGPQCRVGGEVEESIIHGHSNKYHDGFLGHAYVGEWINLGALTTNSDLKNDYGTTQVYVRGRLMDTGDTKVGCFIGDHTKTGIGTLINTGSVIGALCIIVPGGGVLPKFIPSCSWYINHQVTKGFGFKKLVETAQVAMSRRKVKMTPDDAALLEKVREITKGEREEALAKYRFSEKT